MRLPNGPSNVKRATRFPTRREHRSWPRSLHLSPFPRAPRRLHSRRVDTAGATWRGLPRAYWDLFLGTLVNKAGTFVLPFLGVYLASERGYSVARAGVVVSLYGVGAIASGPVSGALADRLGRRPVLVGSLALGGLAMIGLGLLRSPWAIAPWTLALGFVSEGYRAPAAAAVADLVAPEERMRAYGNLYWATNVGCALSAAAGGFLAERGFLWLFLLDGGTTLAYALVVYARVPETRPRAPAAAAAETAGLADALADPALVAFALLGLAFAAVLFQAFTTLPLDLRARGFSPAGIGLVLSVTPVLVVCLQPPATALARRVGGTPLLVATGLFGAAGALCFAAASTAAGFALGMAVVTLGEVASAPAAPAVVAELSPAGLGARYQGVYSASFALAAAASPALGTAMLQGAGPRVLWGAFAAVGLVVAAGHLAAAGPRRRRLAALAG